MNRLKIEALAWGAKWLKKRATEAFAAPRCDSTQPILDSSIPRHRAASVSDRVVVKRTVRVTFVFMPMKLGGKIFSNAAGCRAATPVQARRRRSGGVDRPYRKYANAQSPGARRLHHRGADAALSRARSRHCGGSRFQDSLGEGIRDRGRRIGLRGETNTLFQAASISKPVTAMAAMKLVEERRFALDDDINTILKSWHAPANGVTSAAADELPPLARTTASARCDSAAPSPTVVQVIRGEAAVDPRTGTVHQAAVSGV